MQPVLKIIRPSVVNKIILFNFLLIIICVSCGKDETVQPVIDIPKSFQLPSGEYEGTFTVWYPNDTLSNQTSVIIDTTHFFNAQSPDQIPLGGQGTLTCTDDTLIFDQNTYWTAIYDWNLYLDGKYHYTWDGTHLFFIKELGGSSYFYELDLQ